MIKYDLFRQRALCIYSSSSSFPSMLQQIHTRVLLLLLLLQEMLQIVSVGICGNLLLLRLVRYISYPTAISWDAILVGACHVFKKPSFIPVVFGLKFLLVIQAKISTYIHISPNRGLDLVLSCQLKIFSKEEELFQKLGFFGSGTTTI